MNLPLFIARRIYRNANAEGKQMSRPAVLIAMTGVAIGLAVMIVSVAVIIGFKQEMREKIAGFGSHLQLSNLQAVQAYDALAVSVTDSLMDFLRAYPEVEHAQRYSLKAGMMKTDEAFLGMMLKGVGTEYDLEFFRKHLVEGEIPAFSDSAATQKVLLSKSVADKMKLKVGDKVDTYYLEEKVRIRRLQVAGIYQTHLAEYDNLFLLTDIYTVNRLNNWPRELVSGVELRLRSYEHLPEATLELADTFAGAYDEYGNRYCVRNLEQLHPQIFAWLDVLDVNIWVILVLMIGVAGFTIVSGLLIIIIERTAMIGVLKSLGASNTTIRRLFLWFAVFLIGRGMCWGNVVALTLYFVQKTYGVFKLDPEHYYMETVPVALDAGVFLLVNVGTLLISVLILLGPSYLITRIHPANSMRYE